MIKKILHYLGINKQNKNGVLHLLNKEQKEYINDNLTSPACNFIIKSLNDKGFEAFIVGGALRDLLMQKKPKDFDIVTNATPEQIKELFKNKAIIIGKRFKIVHIRLKKEIVEVSTFRSNSIKNTNEYGRIITDNEFGKIEDDAKRRDFTCNSLYYNPIKNIFLDFNNAINDINNKKISIIGEPLERIKEDPVRILRAIRFAAKLNFTIDENLTNIIKTQSYRLKLEPKPRIFDELCKFLKNGYSYQATLLLDKYKTYKYFHPVFNFLDINDDDITKKIAFDSLKSADERINNDSYISLSFILAGLYWTNIYHEWQNNIKIGNAPINAMTDAIGSFKHNQKNIIGIHNAIMRDVYEIWRIQAFLSHIRNKKVLNLLKNPKFKLGYNFFLLRTKHNHNNNETASWWAKLLSMNDDDDRINFIKKSYKRKYKNKNKKIQQNHENQEN